VAIRVEETVAMTVGDGGQEPAASPSERSPGD